MRTSLILLTPIALLAAAGLVHRLEPTWLRTILAAGETSAPSLSLEERHAHALAALEELRSSWFEEGIAMRVRLGQIDDQIAVTAGASRERLAVARELATVIRDAGDGPIQAVGRPFGSAEDARALLTSWAMEEGEHESVQARLMESREEVAAAAGELDRARRRLDSRIRAARSTFKARTSQVDAARARTQLAALESGAARLGENAGALGELDSVIHDLDMGLFSETTRLRLLEDDRRAAESSGALDDAVRWLRDQEERAVAERRVGQLLLGNKEGQ